MLVCGHSKVLTVTSPPVLKLWGSQRYLGLPYDLTEVKKLFGETFEPKNTLCHFEGKKLEFSKNFNSFVILAYELHNRILVLEKFDDFFL